MVPSRWQRREIERALRKPKLQQCFRVTRRERDAVLRRIDQTAEFVTPLPDLPLPVRDGDDERILGAALAAGADYLATGNHDLLVLAADSRLGGLQIVTVVQFLALVPEPAEDAATPGREGGCAKERK